MVRRLLAVMVLLSLHSSLDNGVEFVTKAMKRLLGWRRRHRHATCVRWNRVNPMKRTLERLLRETDAQDLAEYGLTLAVISAVVAMVVVAIGKSTNALWTQALQTLISAFS